MCPEGGARDDGAGSGAGARSVRLPADGRRGHRGPRRAGPGDRIRVGGAPEDPGAGGVRGALRLSKCRSVGTMARVSPDVNGTRYPILRELRSPRWSRVRELRWLAGRAASRCSSGSEALAPNPAPRTARGLDDPRRSSRGDCAAQGYQRRAAVLPSLRPCATDLTPCIVGA